MQTENPIDKHFKEGLAGHRKDPPPHLWQNIAGAMMTASASSNGHRSNRKPFWWWGSLIALLVMVPVAWITIVITTPGDEMPLYDNYIPYRSTETHIAEATSGFTTRLGGQSQYTPPIHPSGKQHKTIHPETSQQQIVPTEHNLMVSTDTETVATVQPIPKEETPAFQIDPAAEPIHREQKPMQVAITKKESDATPFVMPQQTENVETTPIATTPESSDEHTTLPSDSAREPLYVTPGKTATTADVTTTSNLRAPLNLRHALMLHTAARYNHVGKDNRTDLPVAPEVLLSARINHKRFTISSGAGIGWFYQNNPWEMIHRNVDTVGYYEYVTDVVFGPVYHPIDSTIMGYAPVNVVTATTPQLDTNLMITNSEEKYRVGYLHVPIMVHYDLLVRNRFTLSAQSGVIYHKKIFEKQNRPQAPENRELIALSNQGIPPNRHFWQYQAGLGFQYNSDRLWYIETSLLFRTPVNNWYNPYPQNTKPASMVLDISLGRWF
jgi:hypothetical protein